VTVTRGVADLAEVETRVAGILAERWSGCTVHDLQPLPGGTSSLTYRARVEDAPQSWVVVKMAPPGLEPVRNRDVLRQARILDALSPIADVKVPAVFAADLGSPVDIPPLFVMEYIEGESYEPLLAPLDTVRPTGADVEARVRTAVTMLAAMQGAAPDTVGLAEEPATSLVEEVERWTKAFASCPLSDHAAALEQTCRDWLTRHLPAAIPPVILHGDWRLGNMQCQGPDVHAVIDWEIWSIGDPRIDLAWLMLMASREHPSARDTHAPMPGPPQILEWFEAASGTTVPDIDWAQALVRYKQAAASALLVKNAAKRGESGGEIDRMAAGIDALLSWALTFVEESA
jgi:aminoglycoside phosphotransferase (APT) family kinase protein